MPYLVKHYQTYRMSVTANNYRLKDLLKGKTSLIKWLKVPMIYFHKSTQKSTNLFNLKADRQWKLNICTYLDKHENVNKSLFQLPNPNQIHISGRQLFKLDASMRICSDFTNNIYKSSMKTLFMRLSWNSCMNVKTM